MIFYQFKLRKRLLKSLSILIKFWGKLQSFFKSQQTIDSPLIYNA